LWPKFILLHIFLTAVKDLQYIVTLWKGCALRSSWCSNRLRAWGWMAGVQFLASAIFFLSPQCPAWPTQYLQVVLGVIYPGVKHPEFYISCFKKLLIFIPYFL
jgi:hypothetical protein